MEFEGGEVVAADAVVVDGYNLSRLHIPHKLRTHDLKGAGYNVFYQSKTHKKLKKAREQVEYYENEIKEQQEILNNLQKDSALMERIAREKYMMKRDNEVIYIIQADEDEE